MGPSGAVGNDLGLPKSRVVSRCLDCVLLSGAIRGCVGLFAAVCCCLMMTGSCLVSRASWGLSEAAWDCLDLSGSSWFRQGRSAAAWDCA